MNRVKAAVDIGTNSVRLLVARVNGVSVVPLYREILPTRLGEGLKPGGLLQKGPWERTLDGICRIAGKLAAFRPTEVVAVATSAVREAQNGPEFAEAASEILGVPVRVISGEEEARLSYFGAVQGLGLSEAVVVDIGGGSTEITYPLEGRLMFHSCPVGAVRCTEAQSGREEIRRVVRPAVSGAPPVLPVVGVGGTVTSLVAVHKKLVPYDPVQVHGARLSRETVDGLYGDLCRLDLKHRRRIPGLQPERADIILAGIMILQVLLEELNRPEVIVSEADLLYALLAEGGLETSA